MAASKARKPQQERHEKTNDPKKSILRHSPDSMGFEAKRGDLSASGFLRPGPLILFALLIVALIVVVLGFVAVVYFLRQR